MTIEQRDPHAGLHSEQGALAGEHPGRAVNPVVKVHDLAWLEFEKPDLERAELFARAFGFATVLRTAGRAAAAGQRRRGAVRADPQGTAVAVRRPGVPRGGPDRRGSGSPTPPGGPSRTLPESLGGVAVDLVDPSGARVRVVADPHELPALPGQAPLTLNFGHAVDADQRHAAPAAAARRWCSGSVTWCCRPTEVPCRRWTGTCSTSA